jgi:hypothetical protein
MANLGFIRIKTLKYTYFIDNLEYCGILQVWDSNLDIYLHRDNDLPAYISNTLKEWWQNGELHRDNDKPAIIRNSLRKSKEWYKNGLRHRDGNLPAKITYYITYEDEYECWKNGKCYYDFMFVKLLYLQFLIKFLYFTRRNKFLWSPKNLGGTFTKQQILNLFNVDLSKN